MRQDQDSTFSSLKGRLRVPVKGKLVYRYGAPRAGGGPDWKGIFLRSANGADVKVVAAGRVVFADWMRGFGNLIIVDHGSDYLSIYGNNQALLRDVGDEVLAGDAIALTGASGGSQETGLYFELRHEGKAFDPAKWVNLR